MTRFFRHPANIPIEVETHSQPSPAPDKTHHTLNLSIKGLAFRCNQAFPPGELVGIKIPFVRPPFEAEARVIWCKPREGQFELGVEFLDQDDAFMARMVEQVCHIENYKKAVHRSEGRLLSSEEAANEWISKFASKFPCS